ncbi:sensor histidine kinase [Paraclostridium bifermentans]|uniref:sensor histidine kinase n=1 Tax=Paraclostridium bifermentans TaxID=1490 RepID=UPI00359C2F45
MKKNKNIIALLICFCISIITYNIDDLKYYIDNFSSNFYKSYELDFYLYEAAKNSVYTVVGDNASEKILKHKKESTKILNEDKLANIFVINNDSKQIYSNQGNKDLEEYMKKVQDYPYILEMNFKNDSMYLLQDNKKIQYETKSFGNIALTKKENVTTYIAIPDKDVISKRQENSNDKLYIRYKQYVGYKKEAILFIGSTILAGIVLIAMGIMYMIKSKKNIKNNISIYNSLSIIGVVIISIVSPYNHDPNIFYILINTIATFFICFYSMDLIKYIINNNLELKENKLVVKYAVIFISIIGIQIILSFAGMLMNDNFRYMSSSMLVMRLAIPILMNVVLFYFILRKINKMQHIQKGIHEIRKGNLNYKVDIPNDEFFKDMVEDVNEIGESINNAVEDRLKSERLKTELITNVSHDLKTPLTAIINYISLMKKEDIKPEHVKDYVKVLDARSNRLKVLIDDLFEASKISSNNIELKLEKTDINQLLTQSIVEMDNLIESANLDFVVNTPNEEIYVMLDGDKTWRVFENLISNIVKYSLEATRVYIDIIKTDNKVNITMKNISNHPLNFDANEIIEKCKRGDISRNTEGSGLGLSIAKGFVEAQGGTLNIEIIGDMFIINIDFDTIDSNIEI